MSIIIISCSKKSEGLKEECKQDAEVIDILKGTWRIVESVTSDIDIATRTENSITFDNPKVIFSSENALMDVTYEVYNYNPGLGSGMIRFDYKLVITENDPFDKKTRRDEVVFESDLYKLIKHSCNCFELNPMKGKVSSIFIKSYSNPQVPK